MNVGAMWRLDVLRLVYKRLLCVGSVYKEVGSSSISGGKCSAVGCRLREGYQVQRHRLAIEEAGPAAQDVHH